MIDRDRSVAQDRGRREGENIHVAVPANLPKSFVECDSQGTARWARKVIQEKIDPIIEEGIKRLMLGIR